MISIFCFLFKENVLVEFEIQINVAELIDFNGKYFKLIVIVSFLINNLTAYKYHIAINYFLP